MIVSLFSIVLLITGIVLLAVNVDDYKFVKSHLKYERSFKKKDITDLGRLGEQEVTSILDTLPKDKYVTINNLTYLYNNFTHQIDHIVISNFGIFIIETKNYSGRIYGSDNYNTWSQYIGNNKYKFLNPVLQNYGHIKAISNIIPEYKHYLISVVCFTNKSILKVKTKNHVIQSKELLSFISNYKTEILIQDINEVALHLRNLSIDLDGIAEHHINNIKTIK